MKSQWLKPNEIQLLQSKKLRVLIDHCYNNVPYYNKILKERKLKPYDIKAIDDLQKLPVLTKTIIRKNFKRLIAQNFPLKRMFLSSTGGSMGEPLKFINDDVSLLWINTAVNRSFRWAGYRRFDKMVTVWGFPSRQNQVPTKPWQRQMTLSTFGADEERIKRILMSINWFRPNGIRGYASALYLLAKSNEDVKVKFVISTSEMLFGHYRKLIEESFGCEVYDNYSSREFMMASECEEHTGYHIAAENCILEFIRDNEQVSPGETGRILVTDLTRYGMPFIRYDIQDMGCPSDETCPCGRGLPLMKSVEGRTTDFIFTPSGKYISGPAVTLAFKDLDIEQFQLVEESRGKLVIRIAKGPTYSDADTQFLLNFFRKYAQDMKIKVDFVSNIPVSKSGKRLIVVSKTTLSR